MQDLTPKHGVGIYPNPAGSDDKYIYNITPFDTVVKIGTIVSATA